MEDVSPPLWKQVLVQHPLLVAVAIVSVVAGAIVGGIYLSPEWSPARRVLGGALMGAWCGFLITAIRLMGAWNGDDEG